MRVSIQLEHITSLSHTELSRVLSSIDSEIIRCKIVLKSVESATLYRRLASKINKLQLARATFLSEIHNRQQTQ